MIGARIGRDAFSGIVGTKRHPDPVHGRLLSQDARDGRQHRRGGRANRKLPAHLEQRARLPFPRFGDLRPGTLQRDKLTNDDPDEEEQNEVQPLARIRDGERVEREDEEVVVQQERGDGSDDRAPRARDKGGRDHGREIHRGGIRDADIPL